VMCGVSILSCCPHNPRGHEQALKEEEDANLLNKLHEVIVARAAGNHTVRE